MLRWIIVIVWLALIFSSCHKCKLETTHYLRIEFNQPVVYSSGIWGNSSNATIVNDVVSELNSDFNEPKQLQLVQSHEEYLVTIDSISCSWTQSTETVGDPCWQSGGWLHNALNPQPEYTYTLNTSSFTIYFTMKDTLNDFKKSIFTTSSESEYLYLPPADSTNCYQYEVRGSGDARYDACQQAYCQFKCTIRDWIHGEVEKSTGNSISDK